MGAREQTIAQHAWCEGRSAVSYHQQLITGHYVSFTKPSSRNKYSMDQDNKMICKVISIKGPYTFLLWYCQLLWETIVSTIVLQLYYRHDYGRHHRTYSLKYQKRFCSISMGIVVVLWCAHFNECTYNSTTISTLLLQYSTVHIPSYQSMYHGRTRAIRK